MSEAETALTKYVFLDIVGFTKGRSVEAQSDLINSLNAVVKSVLDSRNQETILLPTGDGICIALLNALSFDIHLEIGLEIIAKIFDYNSENTDKARQFQVRVGLNENIDNLITDINGRRNVAGNGINMAQRIMSLADGNQILIGQAVYEILSGREKYMSNLKRHEGYDKHGNKFPVYQYVAQNNVGLNIEVPSVFKPRQSQEKKLSKLVAYYIAHAIENRDFLFSRREESQFEYAAPILLYFKAIDSVNTSEASQYETSSPRTHGALKATADEQYDYYKQSDFWILADFADFITDSVLAPFGSCFATGKYLRVWSFISAHGAWRLKHEWPSIWQEFSFTGDEIKAD
jgi:class 3 adenylate cyclase